MSFPNYFSRSFLQFAIRRTPPLLLNGAKINIVNQTHRSISSLTLGTSPAVSASYLCQNKLLSAPPSLTTIPSRGMKIKGRVNRRCKDCKMSYIDGVLHNYCETHPRHNQKLKPKYWVNQRILTCVSQTPRIPWGPKCKHFLPAV